MEKTIKGKEAIEWLKKLGMRPKDNFVITFNKDYDKNILLRNSVSTLGSIANNMKLKNKEPISKLQPTVKAPQHLQFNLSQKGSGKKVVMLDVYLLNGELYKTISNVDFEKELRKNHTNVHSSYISKKAETSTKAFIENRNIPTLYKKYVLLLNGKYNGGA